MERNAQRGRYGSRKRDRLITFKREVATESGFGEPEIASLSTIGKAWANVAYGKGSERRAAGIEGSDLPATFITLQNPMTRAIEPSHVIEHNGGLWDITSAAPFERDEIEFTAVRRVT